MIKKGNPFEGMTIDNFMMLLSKKERKEFKRYCAKELIKKHEVEA